MLIGHPAVDPHEMTTLVIDHLADDLSSHDRDVTGKGRPVRSGAILLKSCSDF
jgi:hypothetical protein